MERNEVSRHEIAVFKALLDAGDAWLTSAEITTRANVAPRTARAHALKLVKLGVIDQAEVFPAHRYRVSQFAAKRNRGYTDRLAQAADALGIELTLPS
jgi:hypothetical protein